MKKTFLILITILLLAISNAYSQLEVNADSSITVSRFTVNNFLSGHMGNSSNSNVSFGYKALNNSFTTAHYNVAVGIGALYSITSGFGNTANGYEALSSNTTGYYNTANGLWALHSNTTGFNNTATGHEALSSNETGTHNTATGTGALNSNTTGSYNTANSHWALPSNTTGSSNTAAGPGALGYNTTGSYNTALGSWALAYNVTGSCNTAIGCEMWGGSPGLNNTTAIGYGAATTANNQVRIGNSSVNSIGGYAAWSNISDGRAKKNIRTDVPGLAFINRLQPVTYNLDLDAMDDLLGIDPMGNSRDTLALPLPQELIDITKKARADKEKQVQTGFVAQDVEAIAKTIGYDFSGVDVDDRGIYALRYAEFVVPLVKAVQELSEQNNRLQEQVDELTGLVYKLLGQEIK